MNSLWEEPITVDGAISLSLSKHSDGSGKLVNMIGCEVTCEILEAVEEVLSKKLREVDSKLEYLGVEVSGEESKQ